VLAAIVCLGAPAGAGAADPRYELAGDWSFAGASFELTRKGTTVVGRTTESFQLRGCRVRADLKLLSGFKFDRADGAKDVWSGKSLVIDNGTCKGRYVKSSLEVASDSKFTERPARKRPAVYRRVPPPVSDDDAVVGTWTRNNAGVVVKREGPRFVGSAREAYAIANGCTIPAGTVVWRLEPLAPGRYSGTIQTFLQAPGCRPGALTRSSWSLSLGEGLLTRVAEDGQLFGYDRAP